MLHCSPQHKYSGGENCGKLSWREAWGWGEKEEEEEKKKKEEEQKMEGICSKNDLLKTHLVTLDRGVMNLEVVTMMKLHLS